MQQVKYFLLVSYWSDQIQSGELEGTYATRDVEKCIGLQKMQMKNVKEKEGLGSLDKGDNLILINLFQREKKHEVLDWIELAQDKKQITEQSVSRKAVIT